MHIVAGIKKLQQMTKWDVFETAFSTSLAFSAATCGSRTFVIVVCVPFRTVTIPSAGLVKLRLSAWLEGTERVVKNYGVKQNVWISYFWRIRICIPMSPRTTAHRCGGTVWQFADQSPRRSRA